MSLRTLLAASIALVVAIVISGGLAGCGGGREGASAGTLSTPSTLDAKTAELAAFYQGVDQICAKVSPAVERITRLAASVIQGGSVLEEVQTNALADLHKLHPPSHLHAEYKRFLNALQRRHVATHRFVQALRHDRLRLAGSAGTAMNDEMDKVRETAARLGLDQQCLTA